MLQLPSNVSNPHCPYLINLGGKLVDQLKPLNYDHINFSPTWHETETDIIMKPYSQAE